MLFYIHTYIYIYVLIYFFERTSVVEPVRFLSAPATSSGADTRVHLFRVLNLGEPRVHRGLNYS